MENRWVVSTLHCRRHWERICSILISERKGEKGRCQKARNGPELYLCGSEAAQMAGHAIGCLYLSVILQYVIAYMLWFVIYIYIFCSKFISFRCNISDDARILPKRIPFGSKWRNGFLYIRFGEVSDLVHCFVICTPSIPWQYFWHSDTCDYSFSFWY